MSHLPERKEKICLNCGAELIDRYCQKCGQENVEPKENFLHLTKHFLEDITHFDGKFFSTIKYLVIKPGFVTQEYIKGRRASYINPIRLYLFVSAMFFLLYMSFFVSGDKKHNTKTQNSRRDSALAVIRQGIDTLSAVANEDEKEDTVAVDTSRKIIVTSDGRNLKVVKRSGWMTEETVAEYDSIQNSLPKNQRDAGLKHYYKRKIIASREASRKNADEWVHRFKEKFFHSLPYMLFLSLPLMALILKLLYVRRRKQFFYVSHIIFLLHYYCLVFIAVLASNILEKWCGKAGDVLSSFIRLGYFIYLYAAMKRFYQQGWFKTFVKFLMLLFLGGFMLSMLALLFALNSLLNAGG